MTAEKYDVGIVGLGYVGLTLACAMADVGLKVIGIEKRPDVVEATRNGKPHFSEVGLEKVLARVIGNGCLTVAEEFSPDMSCDSYVITVGTPLGADGVVRLDMIERAAGQVAENMQDGALVVLRSTVKIGTTRNVVAPVIAAGGRTFEIAMCPERTLEGNAMQELRELPQIVGADTEKARDRAAALFGVLTNTTIRVSSLETAEIIKLVDNTSRDVGFAFANEVARLCDAVGVNGYEVINSGKLGYKRTNLPLPGLVGGPCLEKDPHILWQSAKELSVDLEITRSARQVNERQPMETVGFVAREIGRRGLPEDAPVSVLGMAFKGVPETDDLRGSMSLKVVEALKQVLPKVPITVYDPVAAPDMLNSYLTGCRIAETFDDAVADAAVVIIANNHPDLGMRAPKDLQDVLHPDGFIYDYWNHFSKLSASEQGKSYFAVGNAKG